MLLKYYLATTRAKMMYGSSFYRSVAPTTLAKLDPIQNAALRISMGAMRSSPVISLHTEAGILPLSIYRREMLCHHLHRNMGLPRLHPLKKFFGDHDIYINDTTAIAVKSEPVLWISDGMASSS